MIKKVSWSVNYCFFFLLIGWNFSACVKKKDTTNSPLFVLEQIKQQLEAGDLEKLSGHLCAKDAKKITTVTGVGQLVLGNRGKILVDWLKKKLLESQQLSFDHIEFKNEHISGTTATVDAYNTKKEKTRTYHFTKEGENWKLCRE